MIVSELIKKLQALKNHKAKVNIVVGNEDSDFLSLYDIEVFQDKTNDDGLIEIFCNQDMIVIPCPYCGTTEMLCGHNGVGCCSSEYEKEEDRS